MSKINYQSLVELMSKYNYVPGIASLQLVFLLAVYAAGMGIAIYHQPLIGDAITTHIYGAALTVILGLLVLSAAMRQSI